MAVAGNTGGAGGARNIARAQRRRPTPRSIPRTPRAAPPVAPSPAVRERHAAIGVQRAQRVAQRARIKRVQVSAQRKRIGYDRPIVVKRRQKAVAERIIANPRQAVEDTLKHQNPTPQAARVLTQQGLIYKHRGLYYPSNKYEAVKKAQTAAPVMKAMDQTLRPIHAIAGGARAAVRGENVEKAAVRGAKLKDRYLFSDVLKEAGVKGAPAAIAGTALDIAADPTTYLSFGAGSVARRAAMQGARQTEKAAARTLARAEARGVGGAGEQTAAKLTRQAAIKAGATEAEAAKAATRAAKTARRATVVRAGERKAEPAAHGYTTRQWKALGTEGRAAARAAGPKRAGKGITIRFAGKEAPGVRRATGAVTRGARKATRTVAPRASQKVPAATRRFFRHVAPSLRQAGASEAEHLGGRAAARSARSMRAHANLKADRLSRFMDTQVPAELRTELAHALDRGDIRRVRGTESQRAVMSQGEREARDTVAVMYREARDAMRGAYRSGRRAGRLPEDITRATEFLSKGDLRRLERRLGAEEGIQRRALAGAQRREAGVKGRAEVAETVGVERARARGQVVTERARGAAAVEQATQRGRAGVATERVRGREATRAAVGTEHALNRARKARDNARLRLQQELRKPVAKRRGVATLQAKVNAAEQRLGAARGEVHPPAPMSAARPTVEPNEAWLRLQEELHKPVARRHGVAALEAKVRAAGLEVKPTVPIRGRRAEKATEKHRQATAETQAATTRVQRAAELPRIGPHESHEVYLRRLIEYGQRHDLPLVVRRAEKLLASKPPGVKGYFPRTFDERLRKELNIPVKDVGGTARVGPSAAMSRITPGFKRAEQHPLDEVNVARMAEGLAPHSTDTPLVLRNYIEQVARAASQGEFAKDMASHGRQVPFKRGADGKVIQPDVREGEALYKLGFKNGKFDLHKVEGLPEKPTKGGQYVVLHEGTVNNLKTSVEHIAGTAEAARLLDRAQGVWKRRAIASLAYHVRNAIGDIHQHYVATETPAWRIPTNLREGYRAARRAGQQGRLRSVEDLHRATDQTVTVAGKAMHVDDFLAMARKHGVLDAGYISRELRDLGASSAQRATRIGGRVPERLQKIPGAKAAGRKLSRAGENLERYSSNRENMTRLATFKAGLDRGLTEREAGELANRIHVDYGDLSETERIALRRAFPFYTWTARSIPVTARAYVQRPGKFANLEKIREETGAAFTGQSEEQQRGRMTAAVQRQLPFVVKIAGKPVALSFSAPATLLNTMPTGLSSSALSSWLEENRRFWAGMLSPLARGGGEWTSGTNFVTRKQIEDKRRPLVAAPAWVDKLPDEVKSALDVTDKFKDPKTGKTTTGWRGQADWAYDQLMLGWYGQLAGVVGSGRQPAQSKVAAGAGLLGARVDVLGKAESAYAQQQRIYDRLDKIDRRLGIMQQQGITAVNATPEYRRLLDERNALNKQLKPGKGKRARTPSSPLRGGPSGGGFGALRGGGGSSSGFSSLR